MANILEALKTASDFLGRNRNLERSTLLRKESESLVAALSKFNSKAEEIELSLKPGYAEAERLVEGDAKSRVTAVFIRDFTKRHCSSSLVFQRVDKKVRTALLKLAAKDGRLQTLREMLDETKKYREILHALREETPSEIRTKIFRMPPKDFGALVKAVGLEAPRTASGAISSSKAAREKVLKQIVRDKQSDELMIGLGKDA